MSKSLKRQGVVLTIVGLSFLPFAAPQASGQAAGELSPLTFTSLQAITGRLAFQAKCSECHGADLEGGAGPALVGDTFDWSEGPLSDLYDFIQEVMPVGAAGTLTPEEVTSIIAFIAQRNGMTAGDEALPTDHEALETMRFAQ